LFASGLVISWKIIDLNDALRLRNIVKCEARIRDNYLESRIINYSIKTKVKLAKISIKQKPISNSVILKKLWKYLKRDVVLLIAV
jgi:hypothetical protein